MKNEDLDHLLRRALLPLPTADYWEEFPSNVTLRIRRQAHLHKQSASHRSRLLQQPAFGLALGLLVSFVAIGLLVARKKSEADGPAEANLAKARAYYREIAQLFPNQVRAIVFDKKEIHVELAGRADIPISPPILLRICGKGGCQGIVTFRGQQIRVDNKPVDVLLGTRNEIILAGVDTIWTSNEMENHHSQHIQASPL
jgi:hypothetical protein